MATAKEKTAKKTTAAKSPRKTARKIIDREDKIYAEADVKAEEKAIRQVKRTQKKDAAEVRADIKKERAAGTLGHISQVMGAVVVVKFE